MPLWLQWMKSHFDRTDAFMKNILLQTRGISSCKRNQILCLCFRLCQTRILVTHGIAFLPQVDQIIVLQDGRISEVCLFVCLIDEHYSAALSYNRHDNFVACKKPLIISARPR